MNHSEPVAHATIVYESMFGSTRQVAEAIAEGLRETTPVTVMPVKDAPETFPDAGLLVVGAPTHAHGLSRPSSRTEAGKWGDDPERRLALEPDAEGIGVREWLDTCGELPARFAAFDTRADMPEIFSGSAAASDREAVEEAGRPAPAEDRELPRRQEERAGAGRTRPRPRLGPDSGSRADGAGGAELTERTTGASGRPCPGPGRSDSVNAVASMDDEHRAIGMLGARAGHGSQQQSREPSESTAADDQHLGAFRLRDQLARRRAVPDPRRIPVRRRPARTHRALHPPRSSGRPLPVTTPR